MGNKVTIIIDADGQSYIKELEEAAGATDKLDSKSGKLANTMGKNLKWGAAAAAAAFGTVAYATYKAIEAATELNRAMANTATLIPGNAARVRELKGDVQQFAMALGASTQDLAGGLYQVISAFGDAADSTEKLRITAMAAKAGLASTTESLDLLSAVTKGYGETTVEALEKVSDLAFTTVKLGQTTFPELAASMGRVVPLAAKLRISQEELFAGFATLTGVTGNAAEVSTQFAAILRAMMQPTADMAAALRKLGFSGSEAMLKQHGLVDSLKLLMGTTGGTAEEVAELFGRAESLTAVFALTGGQADTFTEKLRAMSTASGTAAEAFKEQTEGINKFDFTVSQLRQTWEVFLQKLGDFITQHPVVIKSIDAVTAALKGFAHIVGIDLRDPKQKLEDYRKELERLEYAQETYNRQKEWEEQRLTAGATMQLEVFRRLNNGSSFLTKVNENLSVNAARIQAVRQEIKKLEDMAKGNDNTPPGGLVPDKPGGVVKATIEQTMKLIEAEQKLRQAGNAAAIEELKRTSGMELKELEHLYSQKNIMADEYYNRKLMVENKVRQAMLDAVQAEIAAEEELYKVKEAALANQPKEVREAAEIEHATRLIELAQKYHGIKNEGDKAELETALALIEIDKQRAALRQDAMRNNPYGGGAIYELLDSLQGAAYRQRQEDMAKTSGMTIEAYREEQAAVAQLMAYDGDNQIANDRKRYQQKLENLRVFNANVLDLMRQTGASQDELAAAQTQLEIEYAKKKRDFQIAYAADSFGAMSNLMQNLYTATGSKNKAMFEAMKAFAIAEAVISTYKGAQQAYTAMAGIPIIGPALGIAAAAAAVAAGMARVQAIKSQKPGSTASISAGGAATPSYGGGSPNAYPAPQRLESEKRPIVVNIQVLGSILNSHDELARDMVPAIQKALEDGVH